MLLAYLKRRKMARLNTLFRHGFDYAAGRLLSDGYGAIAVLETQVDTAIDFGNKTVFDEGIKAAIAKFRERIQNGNYY